MIDVMRERVLGVPTSIVNSVMPNSGFKEYSLVEKAIEDNLQTRDRCDALEVDENFQQLVAYILVQNEGDILYYSRKKAGESESRLDQFLSVGFGGHVNESDYEAAETLKETLMVAAVRELNEELFGDTDFSYWISEPLGFIRDTSNPVGRVHLGVVFECITEVPMSDFPEATLSELKGMSNSLESWSRLTLTIPGIGKVKNVFGN